MGSLRLSVPNCFSEKRTVTSNQYCCDSNEDMLVVLFHREPLCDAQNQGKFLPNDGEQRDPVCWDEAYNNKQGPNCAFGVPNVDGQSTCCVAEGVGLEFVPFNRQCNWNKLSASMLSNGSWMGSDMKKGNDIVY